MKKRSVLIIIMAVIMILCSCEQAEEIEKKPIDCRYTEAHEGIETDYQYVYAPLDGKFVYVPNTHTVFYPEKYEILYVISYSDGSTKEKWEEVDKNTYLSFKDGAE